LSSWYATLVDGSILIYQRLVIRECSGFDELGFWKFSAAASMRIIDRRNSVFVEMKFDKPGHWEVNSGFPRVEVISFDK
jgi:hypothetical protein